MPLIQQRIRKAQPEEANVISALALRSKAHWGYGPEALAVFAQELTLSPADIDARHVHVCEIERVIVGFYSLTAIETPQIELEHIFVAPPSFGSGIGRALFHHACAQALDLGAEALVIKSDPHAAGFYKALGATFTGDIASSIAGRTIPTFKYRLRRTQ